MSMSGEYLRVTTAQLDRAIDDPRWALEFVKEVRKIEQEQEQEQEQEAAPAVARSFSTYKAWDLLRFLLARAEFPVDVILGEEPLAEDEDWGYGPPRYLRSERIGLAAQAFRTTSYDQLISAVDPAELTERSVYPFVWEEPGSLEWGRHWYEGLTQFFQASAAADDAMLVWLA